MKRIFAGILSLSVLLCSCSNPEIITQDDLTSHNSTRQSDSESAISQYEETQSSENNNNIKFSFDEYLQTVSSVVLLYEISDSQVLICTERNGKYPVHIVDTKNAEQSEEIICDIIPQCESNGFWTLMENDNENAMTISNFISADTFSQATIYNYNLEESETISLLNGINADGFDIDIESEQIAYSLTQLTDEETYTYRLNVTDFSFENTETLYETPLAQAPVLAGMDTLHICNDVIIFLGGYSSDLNAQSVRAYGSIAFDTFVPEYVYRADSYGYALANYKNGAYIYECDYPFGVVSSGQCIKIQDAQTNTITLQNTMESLNLYTSKNGEYFATAMTGNNQDGSVIIRISVYSSDGGIIDTFDISFESEEMQSIASVYVFEENRTVYLKTQFAGGGDCWYEFLF